MTGYIWEPELSTFHCLYQRCHRCALCHCYASKLANALLMLVLLLVTGSTMVRDIMMGVIRMACAPAPSGAVWVSNTTPGDGGGKGLGVASITSSAATADWLPVATGTTVARRPESHLQHSLLLPNSLVVWALPQPGEEARVIRSHAIATFLFLHRGHGGGSWSHSSCVHCC